MTKKNGSSKAPKIVIGIVINSVIVSLVAIIGFMGIVIASYKMYVPLYTSTATFTVSTQQNISSVNGISAYSFFYDSSTVNQIVKTSPYIMSSNVMRDSICEDLDMEYFPLVDLRVSSDTGSNKFTLTATGQDPEMTCKVLLSAVENYPEVAKHCIGNVKLKMITQPQIATVPSNSVEFNKPLLISYVAFVVVAVILSIVINIFRIIVINKEKFVPETPQKEDLKK